MIAPARLAAYGALRAVNGRRVDLPAALAQVRQQLGDERDRALTGEIVTGALRWQAALDHVIAAYARRPIGRLDDEVVDVLRLTLFQLLHLDRVPASAAVNDAVDLTRKVGKSSAAALVNAVLRRASRERQKLPLPERLWGDRNREIDYLATTLSHPRWLVDRWRDRYGVDAAEAWCRFDNDAAPLTLRANRLRITREELATRLRQVDVATRPTPFAADGLIVESGNPLLTPLAGDGLFVVQDEASQLIARAMAVVPGETVLDACAAPGGKTTAMAADLGSRGLIVACDVRARRMRLLSATVRASGAARVALVQMHAAGAMPFEPVFDAVLVDAPCSGLGTLRRDPDIKWRRAEEELGELARVQLRMLTAAAAVVRTGGRLIYATCSSEPEENEHVIDRWLASDSRFALRPLTHLPAQLITEAGLLRTLPFRDGLEAFFAAQVVKVAGLG